MALYAPTEDGAAIVSQAGRSGEAARVLPISTAECLLQNWRKSAWDEAAGNGSSYVANSFLSWANSLADALALADRLRAPALAEIVTPNTKAA